MKALNLVYFWPFFNFSWPFKVLNIQNHSNSSDFEAIWPLCKTVFAEDLAKPYDVKGFFSMASHLTGTDSAHF